MLLHLDYLPFQLLTCYGCGYSSVTTMPAVCPQCRQPFTEVMITFMDGTRSRIAVIANQPSLSQVG